jgi:hypothetical protein
MSVAFENVPENAGEPVVVLEVLPQIPAPEATLRLLGAAAVAEEPRGLYEVVVRQGDAYTTDNAREFTHNIHNILLTGLPNAIPPKRVNRFVNDYYNIFQDWTSRIPADQLETKRRTFLRDNIAHAYANRKNNREIELLIQLEKDLREKASDEAADAALVLLAASGCALQPDFVERRMQLLRQTANSDKMHYETKYPVDTL